MATRTWSSPRTSWPVGMHLEHHQRANAQRAREVGLGASRAMKGSAPPQAPRGSQPLIVVHVAQAQGNGAVGAPRRGITGLVNPGVTQSCGTAKLR